MFKMYDFVNRKSWGAAPPLFDGTPLPERVEHVIITKAGVPTCSGVKECSAIIRRMQKYYMNLGMMDIPYNFIISEDHYMFEIRGWKWSSPTPESNPEWKDNAIVTAIVGNFPANATQTSFSISAIATFDRYYAAKTKFLHKDYKPHVLVPNWNTIEDLDEALLSDL